METLLLDGATGLQLVVRDPSGLDLGAVPNDDPIRADQALLAVRTDAEVTVLLRAAIGGTRLAALLRWDKPSSG